MSSPGTDGSAAIAAQWFADPSNPAQWRWWDGTQWTQHVAPIQEQAASQASQVAQVDQLEQARAAHAAQRAAAGYWPVPPLGTPVLAARTEGQPVAFEAMRRRLMRARGASIAGWFVLCGAIFLAGLLIGRVTKAVMLIAINMWRTTLWRVRDDARDVPWSATFMRLGLDEGVHPRWQHMRSRLLVCDDIDDVMMRWSATGELAGMPAACGEFVCCDTDMHDRLTREYRMFAAFELPPLAAARHRGVTVRRRRSVRLTRIWGNGAKLELESIDVAKKLEVEVYQGTDPVTARELFGSQLVAALAERPVEWDQRGDLLLVFESSPKEPGAEFEQFLASAAAVARAYWTDQE